MQSTPSLTPNPDPRRKVRVPVWLFLIAITLLSASLYIIPHLRRHRIPRASLRNGRPTTPSIRPGQTLADSTKVWLNDGSELSYQSDLKSPVRELYLKGEAYFIVPKRNHPLIVHTPAMDVKVNGAILDINAYEGDKIAEASIFGDSAFITLHTNPSIRFGLGSGEKLTIRSEEDTDGRSQPITTLDRVHYQPEDSLFIEAAWVKYRLAGYNTNLEELTPRLQRWYDVKLFITGDQLKKERFTFVLPQLDLRLTLEMLQAIQPFHYTIDRDGVHIQP